MYVLYPGFFPLLAKRGFEVTGICAGGPWVEKICKSGLKLITMPMVRGFAPWLDLKCLWKLYRIFRRQRFDIVHYSTPKAAILSAVAGRLARCPALIYTLRGLGYEAFDGPARAVGKFCEKIACRLADRIIAISASLKARAVEENLVSAERVEVLGAGSSKGVDLDAFRRCKETIADGRKIKQSLGIKDDDLVIGCVGRMTEEKGVLELLIAFISLRTTHSNVHLLLMGHKDQRKPFSPETSQLLSASPNTHVLDFQDNVPDYIAAMDILVLPSYREGFGNALIEASAMRVPVVASDIPGCRDAVLPSMTGLLVRPRDAKELEKALAELIENPGRRVVMGQNGERWVRENFDRNMVWARLIQVYEQVLADSHELQN
jgi:glycosyltransferase involved in cell wall biosynthesis